MQKIFKNLPLIFLLILAGQQLTAQKVAKGFTYLKKGKHEKAIKIFKKAGKDKTDIMAAKYGMALLYLDTSYSKMKYSKAYTYLRNAEKKYSRLKNTDHASRWYNIDEDTFTELKNEISKAAYAEIKDPNSLFELNRFAEKFKGSAEGKNAAQRRNAIAYKIAEEENTYKSYQKFVNSFPDAKEFPQANRKFKALWKNIYEAAAADGEISSIKVFELEYPDYPFYDKTSKKNKEQAMYVSRLNLPVGFLKENLIDYQKYIRASAPKELAFVILQILIEPDLKLGNWANAIDTLQKYQPKFPNDKRIDKMIATLKASSKPMPKKSISDIVNTEKGNEYAPSVTADGKRLYFCGRDRVNNLKEGGEDIFVSHFEGGQWSEPELVGNINTDKEHEAPLSVSADGNRMLMYSKSDIYYTDRTPKGWTRKKRFPAINSSTAWDADALTTADGKAVLFISDRRGNIGRYHPFGQKYHGKAHGNLDIYVSELTNKGWTKPINLGKIINTPFAERSPFLHSDMKTLYFSSEGHGSLGGMDVFKCTRLNDTSWTEWSEPENLGKAINTSQDEYDYEISTDGQRAYFSSFDGYTFDIKTVELPKEHQPEVVTAVRGKVTNQKNEHIFAYIKWENLETGELVGRLKTDPKNGDYYIVLPYGKNYGYYISKKGYYPISGNVDLRGRKVKQNIEQNIQLISLDEILKGEKAIPLTNIFFETGRYNLKPSSYPELKRLSKFLKGQPDIKTEIAGHTDSKGNAKANKTLSEKRAKAVLDYLVKLGCSADALSYKGYGAEKPATGNKSAKGRALNRRVEFKILK